MILGSLGCGAALTVGGDIVRPAEIPVRVFPHIVVVPSDGEESERLARRLAEHLEPGESDVSTRSAQQLEAMRAAGALPAGSVVVTVRAELIRTDEPTWTRRDVMECGPLGCAEMPRSVVEDVPVILGRARLTVTDGPTGRRLQSAGVEASEVGADVMGMRLRVFEELSERATAMVDPHRESVRVELESVDARPVRRALEVIGAGDWARGAALLDRFVASRAFAALSPGDRARVLYDLGESRRFDPSLPPDERFVHASEALRAAVRLAPEPRYAAAIADLQAHRRALVLLRRHREARDHNFRLGRDADSEPVPEPPAAYREGGSPPGP